MIGTLELLKYDLQRNGQELGDDAYSKSLLQAAERHLNRQGILPTPDYDYVQIVVGTAAWMYRKRVTGEAEPAYLKAMRHDLLASQKMRGNGGA